VSKAGAYPRGTHIRRSLYGRLWASPTNIIRLGWKGLPGTNTQAYYEPP